MSIREAILCRDFHVHTSLSVCAQGEMTVPNIVHRAERLGYTWLGISDHLGGYSRPDMLQATREALTDVKTGVRLFLGCEMCVDLSGAPCFPAAEVAFLDYVMVGLDHVIEETVDPTTEPERWLQGWVQRCEGLLACGEWVDVLAHPLRTLRRHHQGKPLMAHLPDARWTALLEGLAAQGIALELNDAIENCETCFDEVRAFYRLAHSAGVKFSIGSDAHGLDRLGFQVNWLRLAEDLGLQPGDLWQPCDD